VISRDAIRPMNSTSKPRTASENGAKAEGRELASAERPVRILLAASIVLPIAIFLIASWSSYQQHLSEARDRVQRNLNTSYEHALKVFETFELSARYLDEMIRNLSDAEIIANEAEYHQRLKTLTSTAPQLNDLTIISQTGVPLVSARFYPSPNTNFSDRPYFSTHKDDPNAGTYISSIQRGPTGKREQFVLTRRRNDSKGAFAGVFAFSISPDYFVDFFSKLPTPGAFGLIRADGVILARFPKPARPITTIPPDSEIFQNIAHQPDEGYITATSAIDGTSRIFGYRKLPKYKIYMVTGIDNNAVISSWLTNIGTNLIFGLPATIAVISLGTVALLRTRRAALAHGKLQHEVERRERTELALHQALKMEAVGRLTGGIAHDFNNLLTAILGNVDLALRRLSNGDERVRRSLNSARQASERAANLVQRLLSFSRQHPLTVKAVNVNLLVQEMSELIRRTIGETITVQTRLADDLWLTAIDPNQLESALLNLAVNARDAMNGGGRLTIETSNVQVDVSRANHHMSELSAGEYVLLTVTDTGSGMSDDVRSRAFEPFFTTKPTGAGSGLGLSMVYGFIKQSGGHIRINSQIGAGTSIWLYLPRLMEGTKAEVWTPGGQASQTENHDSPRRPEKILLVEDEEEVNRFSTEVLRDKGYQVISTHEGASALRLLDANPDIRLLFTDVVLPGGMNGRQLADEALRRHPQLKVLFTTGYTRDAIFHEGRLDANVDLLTKPFTAEALRRKVRQILDLEAADPMVRVRAILDNIKEKPQTTTGQARSDEESGPREAHEQAPDRMSGG